MRLPNQVEKSKNNHFMYWVARSHARDFKPPTTNDHHMKYHQWLKLAHDADAMGIEAEEQHHYLMLGVQPGRTIHKNKKRLGQFVSNDLSVFSTNQENFFVTNVAANKGIQCRFGMKGVIAEAHYDGGKNMVAMLKGAKRYILNPPSECKGLSLISDKKHPSFRHSTVDWSSEEDSLRSGFQNVKAIDTIVHQGEVLYIPSYWVHYITSLDHSIQCNTRSGSPPRHDGEDYINDCMGPGTVGGAGGAAKKFRKNKGHLY